MRGIHHVGVTVADLDRSLRFYADLLGMNVIGISEAEDVGMIIGVVGAKARIADIDAGSGQILELLEYAGGEDGGRRGAPTTPGTCHISLQVEDLSAVLDRLSAARHLPMGEPTELSIGGVWEGCTVVYLRDPDSVIVELIERRPGGIS